MTLSEAGKELGINLDVALERFAGNEGLYIKFLNKMRSDPTFAMLENAVADRDLSAVERAAHTLKGVSANLGLDELSVKCADIVQAVRTEGNDAFGHMDALMETCRQTYSKMISILEELDQGETGC